MIIILPKAKPLFFSIQPLDINGPIGTSYDLSLETMNGLLCIGQGPKLDERTSHKLLIFFHQLDIKNLAK